VAKKITYTVRNIGELAWILEQKDRDTEIRFTFENMVLTEPWYRPRVTHYMMKTRRFGGDTLIAGILDGGYTKIESVTSLIPPTMPFLASYEPSERVKLYENFIAEYLLHFNARQAVLMTTEVISCS
jgi:hypothetical protein